MLDGIEDPHNVGAILRTADAAGAHGVVRQARHAASLDGVVAKASAGAVAHVRIATEVNIARALEELKALNVWTVGLAGGRPGAYDAVDLTLPTALVLGAEGTGLRRLVRERCDRLVSIPMYGAVDSLNVSVAAGVRAVRGGAAAEGAKILGFWLVCSGEAPAGVFLCRPELQGWHGVCYKYSFVWAGVAQSGRAADL